MRIFIVGMLCALAGYLVASAFYHGKLIRLSVFMLGYHRYLDKCLVEKQVSHDYISGALDLSERLYDFMEEEGI